MPPETTPMMQQYLRMKELHPDCILFFRLGDFYEMFNEDAKLVSKELELTLTSRDRGKPEAQRTPMCGVPYHSADAYIARLIAKGYKVAICEQMEDPALAKGLVDRDIIRIITPGTVMTSSMLEEGRNNFICAVYRDSAGTGLCFCDISTGECSVTSFTGPEADEHLYNELGRFTPREAMLSDGAYSDGALVDFLVKRLDCRCENGGEARFRLDAARTAAEKQFSAGLDALPAGDDAALQAVGGLLSYLYETQKTDLSHLSTLTYFTTGQFMELDLTARRNLELTETLRSKEKKGSLLWVLDKTRTAMGHRLIRAWMERPLLSPAAIGRRLGAVGELVGDAIGREELTLTLREITDLERLIGRIVYGTAGGRDLVALANGLGRLPALRERLAGCSSALLASLREELDDLTELRELIGRAIVDEPPFSVREGGFIRAGYHPEVDRLRDIMANGKGLVASIEAREKEKTGIKSLKVGYNKVFGYYIEVSKSYYDQVPDTYIRKQTLTNCERFITQELKELEHEILSPRTASPPWSLSCSATCGSRRPPRWGGFSAPPPPWPRWMCSPPLPPWPPSRITAAPKWISPTPSRSPRAATRWWRRCSNTPFSSPTTPTWTTATTRWPSSPAPTWRASPPTCARWPSLCSWPRWAPSSPPAPPASASWTGCSPASAPATTSPPGSPPSWWR